MFTALKVTSSGLDITIFQRFKDKWQWIDQSTYEMAAGMSEITDFKDSSTAFSMKCLVPTAKRRLQGDVRTV